MAVGDRIRELREAQGLSLSELARMSGVAKGWLWELEQERDSDKRPSAATLLKVARALGTSVADLLEADTNEADAANRGVAVPDTLRAYAKSAKIPDADVQMLASIRYRGQAPQSAEDWQFIYESIRRSVEKR